MTNAMVPKIIHRIVGPKGNGLTEKCLNSWEILHYHGFEIRTWNDDSILKFISKCHPFAISAFSKARNHGEAADIARYLIIYEFGGYYMDWDVQLIDLEKFLKIVRDFPNGFLIQDPFNQTIASESFSGLIREPFLLGLAESIVYIYENGFRDSMSTPYFSGPFRMRDFYYYRKKQTMQNIIKVKDIFLYDYSEIRDMPKRDEKTALIHYWMHSWFSKS